MKDYQHLRFCCTFECTKHEMMRLFKSMNVKEAVWDRTELAVTLPGYRWNFVPESYGVERLCARIIDSWDKCPHRILDPYTMEFLKVKEGRERR